MGALADDSNAREERPEWQQLRITRNELSLGQFALPAQLHN
jgi:hypothetical protein